VLVEFSHPSPKPPLAYLLAVFFITPFAVMEVVPFHPAVILFRPSGVVR
jgi:hypothetical protein